MGHIRDSFVATLAAIPLLVALNAAPAMAGTHDNRPKILVHVTPIVTKNSCTAGGLADCMQAVTKAALTPIGGPNYYFVYLHAARGSLAGLAGLQCGITYHQGSPADINDLAGIDVFGWTLCATLEFISPGTNMWPKPGGGNLMTWDGMNDCQTGDTGVAGYFYGAAYSLDTFAVTKRPVDESAKVANCENMETTLFESDLGCAHFSSGALVDGCNPCVQACLVDPVETATWSRIKTFSR